ncbi:uncharacterized protein LOC118753112 [Rhagoletis pomonella]|uniref:uncharacterized protein LOC118753112 n=1 Tax=Rhagoletis pomonella TaxID=28610 RepID=UPI0017832826|nr:uncharacterized protein LOC118753112 [Rhagoletis pomonella]
MALFQRITTIFCLGIISLLCCCNLCVGTAFFPTNSAYGIFAAIAVPLELPHRNVFISYNFEANYNLPYTYTIPPIATGIEDDDIFSQSEAARQMSQSDDSCSNCTKTTTMPPVNATSNDKEQSQRRRRRKSAVNSLLTRTHFYHILRDKFERSGYSGEPCLLRLICETNSSGLGEVNGVLGTLVHIFFSPSTSANENLPLSYYQAELDGTHDFCEHYAADCEENPLDLISAPLGDIIDDLMGSQ